MDKKKILVVEDEKAISDILVFNLQREGYDTLAAYDGAEGLRCALEEAPDLILLDVMLPEMDGFEGNTGVIILAATNRDLRAEVAAGRFRQDLYYRLSAFSVELPPLRSCPEDVCFLIDRLMEKIPQKYGVPPRSLSGEAFGKLLAYNWPGNIRELENVLENAVALSESELIYAEHIHLEGTAPAPLTLKERLKREERQILRQTLAQCGGSRVKAMGLLGLSKTVFYGKLKEYQLD